MIMKYTQTAKIRSGDAIFDHEYTLKRQRLRLGGAVLDHGQQLNAVELLVAQILRPVG